jgi:hypothetical protein
VPRELTHAERFLAPPRPCRLSYTNDLTGLATWDEHPRLGSCYEEDAYNGCF